MLKLNISEAIALRDQLFGLLGDGRSIFVDGRSTNKIKAFGVGSTEKIELIAEAALQIKYMWAYGGD